MEVFFFFVELPLYTFMAMAAALLVLDLKKMLRPVTIRSLTSLYPVLINRLMS